MKIDQIRAQSILDTRGRPTIETTLIGGGFTAIASVPSGKSTGTHEAVELRDADGGVAGAINNVTGEIRDALVGHEVTSADDIDALLIALDGTPNKSRLGANAILSVSIAAQRLEALTEDVPLWKSIANRAGTMPSAPRLYVNVINGGVHAPTTQKLQRAGDFKLPFQEYILVIEGKASEALPLAHELFDKLGEQMPGVPMGDEGGYAPTFDTLEKPFGLIAALVEKHPNTSIAIDAAASEFYTDGRYTVLGKPYTPDELAQIYANLVAHFPMHSIEDPFDEEAASDFTQLTARIGAQTLIVGDDLTVTNPTRITTAIAQKEINAVLIKPNQIGTVKEAIRAVQMTHAAGWKTVASHRSGETDDTFIADFAYGVGAHGIKAGGLGQKERLEKYKRLVAIEQEARSV